MSYLIYPLYTDADDNDFLGCLQSTKRQRIDENPSLGYIRHMRDLVTQGSLVLDPGLYFLLHPNTDDPLSQMKGMLFTVHDDGTIEQGGSTSSATTRTPRLTTWPPKP